MKTAEGSSVGARSLARSTLGVEGCVGALGWALGKSNQLLTQTYTNQTTSWLMHSWSTFRARISHGQTRIHKTHHNLDLGEATTFPLIVYYVLSHRSNTRISFCLETLKWESRNSQNWNSRDFGSS